MESVLLVLFYERLGRFKPITIEEIVIFMIKRIIK